MRLPLVPLCLLYAACALPAAAQFSVTQALSAPFSNQLIAAPEKARVAWFTDAEGHRNVWVAGTHETARTVTRNTADDGQDIDDITWSRDGEQLAWTRGTAPAGSDHTLAANPAELPGTVQQHIELADLRSGPQGPVRSIAAGHTPLFLAEGAHLLFLRRGTIWIADLRPGAAMPPSMPGQPAQHTEAATESTSEQASSESSDASRGIHPLLQVRGSAHGLRLSPDGSQLAFVSDRGDHSFIGVYTFATRALTWMDPGTGNDHDPTWSPDGKQIAFVREVPIVSPIADRWMREGQPWSIRIADIATGEGLALWRAEPGPGSLFHAVSAHDQLVWTGDGRIVFPWEQSGWVQLYAIPAASCKCKPDLLTPGDFEVDTVASFLAREHSLFFSGNRVGSDPLDADRRHLWRVDLQDTNRDSRNAHSRGLQPVTRGSGIETEPALLSDGTLTALAGTAQQPLVPVQVNTSQLRPLAPQLVPASFPAEQFVTPQQVLFPAADGLQMHGQLFVPRNAKAGARLPAVVFFHGGSRRQMLLGFHPMQYYAQAYEFNQYLASRGFIVLSVNYRSGVGYGLNFRQALHYGANGGTEDEDVVGAANYLRSRTDVDPHRMGAWGGSYGGYLTALALARHSDLYAAGVDLHGVHDWSLELDLNRPTDEPGVDQASIAKRAFLSSPMASLDTWKSPVLLIQGDDDRNVLFAQTVRLAAELRSRGVPVEEKVFPDEVHDFLLHRNWITSYRLAADFLERNLQSK